MEERKKIKVIRFKNPKLRFHPVPVFQFIDGLRDGKKNRASVDDQNILLQNCHMDKAVESFKAYCSKVKESAFILINEQYKDFEKLSVKYSNNAGQSGRVDSSLRSSKEAANIEIAMELLSIADDCLAVGYYAEELINQTCSTICRRLNPYVYGVSFTYPGIRLSPVFESVRDQNIKEIESLNNVYQIIQSKAEFIRNQLMAKGEMTEDEAL